MILELTTALLNKEELRRVKVKAYQAAYYKANLEKHKARMTAYQKANPEKSKAYNAAYRKANPEKEKARCDAWKKANLKKCNANVAASKRRKRSALLFLQMTAGAAELAKLSTQTKTQNATN